MNVIKCCFLGAVSLSLLSCAGGTKLKPHQYDCSARLNDAVKKYESKRYADAEKILEDIKYQCGGNPIMDSVLYIKAMTYLHAKSYPEARTEFERLTRDYASSPLHAEAQFRAAWITLKESNPSNRDQSETDDAIRQLREFLDQSPEGQFADSARACLVQARDKLGEKVYNNARFYEKINEPEAAMVYYQNLINDYPDSKFIPQSMLNIAGILIHLDRTSEAKEVLDKVVMTSKDDEVVGKAKVLMLKIKSSN